MSARDWIAGALLYTGVIVAVASCIGSVVARNLYDRLHFIAPATSLGASLVCSAVVVNEGTSQAGLKALLVAALLVTTGPVLVHATARAARVRELGRWGLRQNERERATR